MEDYPKSHLALEDRFSEEDACREYLFTLRWPDGFVCPRCGGGRAWPMSRGLWLCSSCRLQTSVTAGTIFERTRSPLALWFRAMWYVTSQKNGTSALGLQRVLGLGSYQTAWTWLHKLRRAMVRPGRDRLRGRVEVDETFVGGLEEGLHGRGAESKILVAIAAEEDGNGIGRIRMACIPNASAKSLEGFVGQAVDSGAIVRTDGWLGYQGLKKRGYRHRVKVIRGSGKTASQLLPRVHRVASLLDRWLLGTHQGGVSPQHLGYYLDEFTFRFNRRKSRSRGKLFYRLVQQALQVGPVSYNGIVNHAQPHIGVG